MKSESEIRNWKWTEGSRQKDNDKDKDKDKYDYTKSKTWCMGAVIVFVWREGAKEVQLDLFRSGAQRQPRIVVGEQGLQQGLSSS